MSIRVTTPFTESAARALRCGDEVLLSGIVYTARDAAHKKMMALLKSGSPLPFDAADSVIYYVGPTPARPGEVIGSAGPTTSARMDRYAPALLALGSRGMIGKGQRSAEVIAAMKTYGGVYFGAIGGAGALLAKHVVKAEIIAFEELGPEAIRKLEVVDFPVTVVMDSNGGNLYESGRTAYLKSRAGQDPGDCR